MYSRSPQERQRAQQLRNNEIDRDHPDSFTQAPPSSVQTVTQSKTLAAKKNHYITRGKSSPSPPPPPPPEPGFILGTSAEISPPVSLFLIKEIVEKCSLSADCDQDLYTITTRLATWLIFIANDNKHFHVITKPFSYIDSPVVCVHIYIFCWRKLTTPRSLSYRSNSPMTLRRK